MKKTATTNLDLYLATSERAAGVVISSYSTSFGLASGLLAPEIRRHVRNIYALVRIADEIVDGSAAQAKVYGDVDPKRILDDLERDTYRAIKDHYSANPVLHAFAHTANSCGIQREIILPFYESMRMDLWKTRHDQKSFDKYVYGSAEVIGLMCLQTFLVGIETSPTAREEMVAGARALGAAFQKVNFLRDLSADARGLGRSYFPGVSPENFSEQEKTRIIEDIRQDLAVSAKSIPLLPRGSRRAVIAAHLLFEALNEQIAATPAEEVIAARISVPAFKKLVILVRAWLGFGPR